MVNATKACLDEAVAIVGADKPAGPGSESYDPTQLLGLAVRWSEEHRFPREFLPFKHLLTLSRGHSSSPRAILSVV